MPSALNAILCMATSAEDEPIPLFAGREDGTIEKYISIADADLGRPSRILRGHRKAVTGLVAISSDEVYSCSLDGTVKHWNADVSVEGRPLLTSHDFPCSMRCIASYEGRLYVGGGDGSLYVVDGDRQSSWPGHTEAITCVAVSFTSGHVVTGSMDHHVLIWDPAVGKPICLLMGHRNPITCLCVVPGDEDDGGDPLAAVSDGAVLSFSSDRTMKVWGLPFPEDEIEEDTSDDVESEDRRVAQVVSFKEPNSEAVTERESGAEATAGEQTEPTNGVEEFERPRGSFSGEHSNAETSDAELNDASSVRGIIQSAAPKSAIKKSGKRPLRRGETLGTFEIPEVPYTLYQPVESPLAYLGATGGYVWAIRVGAIAKTVLRFIAQNRFNTRKEVRATKQTLTKSVALMRKECRREIRKETTKAIRVARRAHDEKRKKELEERRKAREAVAAEREANRAARLQLGEESDEEEEEEDFDAEGEEEEEEDEEGVDRLHLLSADERQTLDAFIKEREEQRDAKIKALQDAVAVHLAKVEPLVRSTYDRTRDQFYRLKGTTYATVGPNTVKALVWAGGRVYASQGNRVVVTEVTPGLNRL